MKNKVKRRSKQVLGELGFSITDEQPEILEEEGRIKLDVLAQKDGKSYGVEIKTSSNLQSFLKTSFFRAIARVRAAHERKGWNPLVLLLLNEDPGAKLEKVKDRFQLYAPDVSWICDPPSASPVYQLEFDQHLSNNPVERNMGNDQIQGPPASSRGLEEVMNDQQSAGSLTFSDLTLWLFKSLYYNHYLPEYDPENGTKKIQNGNQLSNHARVSLPVVYDWLDAMEEEGYLERVKRKALRLQKVNEYLKLWTGKYRINENPNQVKMRFVRKTDDPYQKLIKKLKQMSGEKKNRYLLTGHPACRKYGLSITSASSLQLFRRNDFLKNLENDLNLVPAQSKPHDLVSYRPKFEEAVFRGQQVIDDVPVVDPIQLYLDCYHLKDRGLEQAEKVRDHFSNQIDFHMS